MSKRRIVARIDLGAINNNINELYKHMPDPKPIMAVIKANGYGHGAVEIAHVLENNEHVCGYAVATSEEALELRNAGINKMILILGYVFKEDFEDLINADVSLTIFNYATAKELSDTAVRLGKSSKIHIKLDTGMARIGFQPLDSSLEEINKIKQLPNLDMVGIFTHFARADEYDNTKALEQLSIYNDFVDKLNSMGISFEIRHCSNSAAILMHPYAHHKMVRAGIVLYGLMPSDETNIDGVNLKPAMSIFSHIVNVKTVEKGTAISYGGTFVAPKQMRVATIPVGYADGYPRSLSNKGYVLINGKRANILGRVCMDQMMVDITNIKAEPYDEVVLLGKSQQEEITAEQLGDLSGRFNYELVCDINPRVIREYI